MEFKNEVIGWFKNLQDDICQQLEAVDGKAKFHQDLWERPGGGGGRTRIIQNGNAYEKGGVNFSAVHGTLPQNIQNALNLSENRFLATGVSIVIHPQNPFVPIIHMNVRYFELEDGTFWFGGGIDLTPHYIIEADARYFHQQLKTACDAHHPTYYPTFKKWADDYFFIPHRNETRGIGGIFFDKLNESDGFTKTQRWDFVKQIGKTFAPTYVELSNRNKNTAFTPENKQWQMLRRSRYVEFNLVYDKGTKFGLQTAGRIESILMSMPPQAQWVYNHHPQPNSPEANTLNLLKKGVEWV